MLGEGTTSLEYCVQNNNNIVLFFLNALVLELSTILLIGNVLHSSCKIIKILYLGTYVILVVCNFLYACVTLNSNNDLIFVASKL